MYLQRCRKNNEIALFSQ